MILFSNYKLKNKMDRFSNSTSFLILGTIFVLFAFFQKHAISVIGLVLLYLGYKNVNLTTNMMYLMMIWILFAIFYDFRFSLGFQGNFLLF
jgi:hypothetical protein